MPGNERPIGLAEYGAMRFCRLPKNLYLNKKRYGGLSYKAMVLYAILFDRMALSAANKWVDETGLFIYAKRKELAELMGLSDSKLQEGIAELKRYGLLLSIRQAMGQPSKVYLFLPETDEAEDPAAEWGERQSEDINVTCDCQTSRFRDYRTPGMGSTKLPESGGQTSRKGEENNETELNDTNKRETEKTVGGSGEPAPAKKARDKKKPSTRSLIPTLDEVKAHADEKGISEDTAEAFFDYWESMGWKRRGSPLVKWKAAFATWVRNDEKWSKEKAPGRPTDKKDEAPAPDKYEEDIQKMNERWRAIFSEDAEREEEERRRRSEAAEKWNEAIKGWQGDLKMKMMGG